MKLDRDLNARGLGKYAIINLRRLYETCGDPSTFERWTPGVAQALKTLSDVGALEWGVVGERDEFFLLKLKYLHAKPALEAYAASAQSVDPEFASTVRALANRAGTSSPFCKAPD